MSLFKTELQRYASFIESALEHTIPSTLADYGDDMRKQEMHRFVLSWGKRLRPVLAMMMADELWFLSQESINVFCSLEVFHDFILAHDDIIDQDDMRRWQKTLHAVMQDNLSQYDIQDRRHFGHAQAIIWWDVLYSLAQDCILDSDLKASRKVTLIKLLSQTIQSISYGWYKQFLSDTIPLSDMTLDYIIQYNLIAVTGNYTVLFPLQFGQAIAVGNPEISPELREFADNLGILFQTWDDIIGLFGDPSVTGKSDHGDITQGKKTIPMYLAYTHAPEVDKVWLNEHLWKKDLSDTDIARIKQIVTDYGLEPTKAFLADYAHRCREWLQNLPYSDHWKKIFADLIEYLIGREF